MSMEDYPLHKKYIVIGTLLLLFSSSFLIFLEIDAEDFINHFLSFSTVEGLLSAFFVVSLVVILIGFLLQKLKQKKNSDS